MKKSIKPAFVVTKEDLDALIPLVERFSVFVNELCEAKIREYTLLATPKSV